MGNFLHAVLPIACRTRSTYTDRQNRMNQYKKKLLKVERDTIKFSNIHCRVVSW